MTPGKAGPAVATGAATRTALRWPHYACATLVGAANTLSFAPVPFGGWLEWPLFAVLFVLLCRTRTARGAALTGGAFGFGNFVTGVYWLYVSMHVYGGMPAVLAGAAVVLFTLYLALYPACAAGVWRALTPPALTPGWHAALLFGSVWALGEWLRGWVFTGFPWLASGYAQMDGPFGGFAPLGGVYGVGGILATAGALLACIALRWRRPAPRRGSVALTLLLVVLLMLGVGLRALPWTQATGAPLRVRLLQGNVPQSMKFEQAGIDAALALYRRLMTEASADVVITPETALPVLANQLPDDLAQAMRRFVDSSGSALLFGAVGVTPLPHGDAALTNSLFGITPGVSGVYRYDKNHLVPFGEFVPWGFHWFVALMNIPLGDFARGAPVQAPFMVHGLALLPDICYEDIFGEEIAATLRGRPGLPSILVNSTNLGWFGDTIALDQHLQIARLRALETGRPVLRATNTGATAAIDARGRVTARLAPLTLGVLSTEVQATEGATPYVRFGNLPVVTLSLLVIAAGACLRRKARGESAALAKTSHKR